MKAPVPTFEEKFQSALQHFAAGRLGMAWTAAQALLETQMQHPGVLQLLGEIAWQQGNNTTAEDLFSRAVAGNPRDPQAHYRLANVLFARRQIDDAANHYRQALHLKPDYWQVSVNLGLLYRAEGRFQEARECFEQALVVRPDLTVVFCYRLDLLLSLGELSLIKAMSSQIQMVVNRCIANDEERDFAALMYLSPLVSVSRQDYHALSAKMDRLLHKQDTDLLFKAPFPGSRLRIGYVSPDFGDHPVSHVMLGLFGQHDRNQFEIIAYSVSTRTGEADRRYAEKIRQSCDDYVDLSGLTARKAAERIATDGVVVLVNLAGYMSPPSLDIFSWRPAPVQVYWLGHGGGLGLSFIDYVIADAVVIPPGEEHSYREKVVRLPESYHCSDTPPVPDLQQSRADHGLDDDAFVFCAFNNPNKINGDVFDAWMAILRRVPDSQIWLSNPAGNSGLESNLRREAELRGVNPERLIFAPRLADKSLHLARHRLADLFLDTFVYNASTTAIDALWAGLPVLTRAGKDFYSRICTSHVINTGLAEMVCTSTQEYEERAIHFANNPAALAAVRSLLNANLHTEPLFDLPRFTHRLEDAYMSMWKYYITGRKPEHINLSSGLMTGD
jgi:predicted O-linked N-acetylglucosamine transferase (SPINDLY family)